MGKVKSITFETVKFIPDGEKKAEKFSPNQIKEAFKIDMGIYKAIIFPDDDIPCFLRVLEDGKIKLYEYFLKPPPMISPTGFSNGGSVMRWFIQKENSGLLEIKTNGSLSDRNKKKDTFLQLIADNSHLTERYHTNRKLNYELIRSLVVEYNKKAAE